jgi:hypothetical protein
MLLGRSVFAALRQALVSELPIMEIIPAEAKPRQDTRTFRAPVYVTQASVQGK